MGARRFERGRRVIGESLGVGVLFGGEVIGVPAGQLL
jgi:hypothetical protein